VKAHYAFQVLKCYLQSKNRVKVIIMENSVEWNKIERDSVEWNTVT
jgi:hypothetical protein